MRSSGVLMHISSLPSPYGIGSMGIEARRFIDFLKSAGQSYWQVLPISPTGYGDSPYQSFSSYAGNPYFIDLDMLCEQGFLKTEEFSGIDWGKNSEKVDFGKLFLSRINVLKIAACRLLVSENAEFNRFCLENSWWLKDYALFMALKEKYGGASWTSWPRELRFREENAIENARSKMNEEIMVCQAIQFFFCLQWNEMKAYANKKGVMIIGDIPIYAAPDSVDVWACPEIFMLDDDLRLVEVSGCPPDGFTEEGQLWGNPLYDWDALRDSGYEWWIRRIDYQFKLFDVLRIDHFRGFDSYYAIPGDAKNARDGCWRRGPGMELFKAFGKRRIIAEDLGFLTDSVRTLLEETGYPGMKVLQFAFDSREESDYLPHNFISNCAAYAGTHDNSTMLGWFQSAGQSDAIKTREYMRIGEEDDPVEVTIATLWSSVADLAIASMQDLLRLDDTARMNTPGTIGDNWQWRMAPGKDLNDIAKKLRRITELYGRIPTSGNTEMYT